MSRSEYVLTVFDQGKAILSCPEVITPEQFEAIKARFNTWANSDGTDILMMNGTVVRLREKAPDTLEIVHD